MLATEQLEDNLGAAGWRLDDDQVRRLSEASAPEDTYPYRFIRNVQRVWEASVIELQGEQFGRIVAWIRTPLA